MPSRRLAVILLALAASTTAVAADKKPAKESAGVFGLDKVWTMHLTVQPKDWEKMQPTNRGNMFGGGFGPARPAEKGKAKPAEKSGDRKPHGLFGLDFEYVKASVEIDGKVYKDVGVRYKGSGTYISARGLKRPFKIDLDRHVEGQSFMGLKKLTLNNNAMEPTATREVLAYGVFRTLGVPAPRTAYAALTLTVPGKYDKEFLGLYVLAESVDKPFLKEHFGSAKGLLLKPERVGALDHLGDDWSAYERSYQPKTTAAKKAQQRLIDFTRLVQKADDQTFAREIAGYLDVDEFLRFLAGNVALSSMDSFIGLARNFYLYLDARTNKFVFIPWDVDLAFGMFLVAGSPEGLMDLSIQRPCSGRNRLVERLLADKKVYAAYAKHLERAVTTVLTPQRVKKDLAAIHAAIDPILEKEKKAASARREGGGFAVGMFARAPAVETFVEKRVASVKGQLAGERKGTVLTFGFGGPGGGGFGPPGGFGAGQVLARPMLAAADKDRDRLLSKEEATAAARALFKALDAEGKGELDQKAVAAGLDKLIPGPRFPGGRPGGMPTLGERLARVAVEKAGKDGKVAEAGLVAALGRLFAEADQNKDGKLDEKELTDGVNKLLPPQAPPPGAFGPGQFLVRPILGAADKDKDSKLSKDELLSGARALFKALDAEGKGELDQKAAAAGLDKLLPGPRFPGGRAPAGFPTLGERLARVAVGKAGKDGKVAEAGLLAAAGTFFAEADQNKDGKLDEKELTEALNKLLAAPAR